MSIETTPNGDVHIHCNVIVAEADRTLGELLCRFLVLKPCQRERVLELLARLDSENQAD